MTSSSPSLRRQPSITMQEPAIGTCRYCLSDDSKRRVPLSPSTTLCHSRLTSGSKQECPQEAAVQNSHSKQVLHAHRFCRRLPVSSHGPFAAALRMLLPLLSLLCVAVPQTSAYIFDLGGVTSFAQCDTVLAAVNLSTANVCSLYIVLIMNTDARNLLTESGLSDSSRSNSVRQTQRHLCPLFPNQHRARYDTAVSLHVLFPAPRPRQ